MGQRSIGPAVRLLTAVVVLAAGRLAWGEDLGPGIERIMLARHEAGEFNGSVLVARDGNVVYTRGFGFANLEWRTPNSPATKFEIGSITKQFTALLVLQFVGEGRIELNGWLSDYLPYYRSDTGRRITVHQLLAHTSGIPDFLDAPGFFDGSDSRRSYEVKEFVQSHCSGDLKFEPGTLLVLAKVADLAHSRIYELRRSRTTTERLLRAAGLGSPPNSPPKTGSSLVPVTRDGEASDLHPSDAACRLPWSAAASANPPFAEGWSRESRLGRIQAGWRK